MAKGRLKVGGGTLSRPASSTHVPYSTPYTASRVRIPAPIAALIEPHTVPYMGKVLHTAVPETAAGNDRAHQPPTTPTLLPGSATSAVAYERLPQESRSLPRPGLLFLLRGQDLNLRPLVMSPASYRTAPPRAADSLSAVILRVIPSQIVISRSSYVRWFD